MVVFKELGVLFVKHFYIVGEALDVVSTASSGNILRRSSEQLDKSIVVVVGRSVMDEYRLSAKLFLLAFFGLKRCLKGVVR